MSENTSDAPARHAGVKSKQTSDLERFLRPVRIMVQGRARPDQIEQAKAALQSIVAPIRANPDCLEFCVYQDRQDPASFVLWEQWSSDEALTAHGKQDYMADYWAQKDILFESLSGDFLEEC